MAADVVIPEPLELLVEQSLGLHPNPRRPLSAQEMVAADLYGGYAHLLVRTAAVRAEEFNEADIPHIGGYEDAVRVASHLREASSHRFLVLMLDGRNRLLAIYENEGGFHEGTLNDLLRAPFLVSSRAVIFCHNHPEGSAEPTPRDVKRTWDARKALEAAGVALLDHVIFSPEGDISMLEKGTLLR